MISMPMKPGAPNEMLWSPGAPILFVLETWSLAYFRRKPWSPEPPWEPDCSLAAAQLKSQSPKVFLVFTLEKASKTHVRWLCHKLRLTAVIQILNRVDLQELYHALF